MPKDFDIKNGFARYIHIVLKKVNPEAQIDAHAMNNVNRMLHHAMAKIIEQDLVLKGDRKTYSARDVQAAVQLALPTGIAKFAVKAGIDAMFEYTTNTGVRNAADRAKLVIPPPLVKRTLRNRLSRARTQIGETAPVYLAGALEWLTADILDRSAEAAMERKKTHRISPKDIALAISNDVELQIFFDGVLNGGVTNPLFRNTGKYVML